MTLNTAEDNSAASFLYFVRRVLATRGLFNSPSGIDFLPRGLARQVGDVRCDTTALAIEETSTGVAGTWQPSGSPQQTTEAAACVVVLPARNPQKLHHRCTPR